VGNASWYGPGSMRKTANARSRAKLYRGSPHLPFGSLVRVVEHRTGKFELVRIMTAVPIKKDAN